MVSTETDWTTYKDEIRYATDFVALVEEIVGLMARRPHDGSPTMVHCPWHDDHNPSLAVYADHATCFGACSETWDVFGWAMKVWDQDFPAACRELARRAGIPQPAEATGDAPILAAEMAYEEGLAVVARVFSENLWQTPHALAYAHHRGWADETLRREQVGCATGDRQALDNALRQAGLPTGHRAAQVAHKLCAWASDVGGALFYVHRQDGRVVYLSARSLEGKQHYNPPAELAGPRHPYLNAYHRCGSELFIVEGQADAVTLAQWGLPGLALAGCSASDGLVEDLRRRPSVWLALDHDTTGSKTTRTLADRLGPLTRILTWPTDAHDANDALQAGVTAAQIEQARQNAPEWVDILGQEAAAQNGPDRDTALRHYFASVAQLDPFALSARRKHLARTLGLRLKEFDGLLAATTAAPEAASATSEDDAPPMVSSVGGYIPFANVLFEMIVTQEEHPRALFAVRWSDGRISTEPWLDVGGTHYRPLKPTLDLIRKGVVLFPAAIGEYEGEVALQAEVQAFIHQYVELDPFYEKLASYYAIFSWLYDSFSVLPYLRALGDYGTGKTRFLQTVGVLCYRPMFAGGASTTSPLFRIIDQMRGTLILDEADFAASDAQADIIKILNCGYMAGFPVLRTVKEAEQFNVIALDVFGPKLIATRRRYADKALESRMLTHEMRGSRPRPDIPLILPRAFHAQALALRNKLLRYRLIHWRPAVEVDLSQLDRSLEPRLNQVILALQTIVQDEALRGDIRAFLREYNRQLVVDRSMTLEALVLESLVGLRQVTTQEKNTPPPRSYPLKDLTQQVNLALADEVGEGEEADRLTEKKVGSILRGKLQLRTEKRAGRFYAIWDEERIAALVARYGLEISDMTS